VARRTYRAKPIGWRGESHRHYLAAKGISTKRYNASAASSWFKDYADKREEFSKGARARINRRDEQIAGAQKAAEAQARSDLTVEERTLLNTLQEDIGGKRREDSRMKVMLDTHGPQKLKDSVREYIQVLAREALLYEKNPTEAPGEYKAAEDKLLIAKGILKQVEPTEEGKTPKSFYNLRVPEINLIEESLDTNLQLREDAVKRFDAVKAAMKSNAPEGAPEEYPVEYTDETKGTTIGAKSEKDMKNALRETELDY